MKSLLYVFLSTISLVGVSHAQDIELGGGVRITREQVNQISQALPKTTEDRIFYHWTTKANGLRWISQGNVNSGEMNFLNTPTGEKQVYGPGLYLAEKPTSSMNFGEVPVAFKIEKGTPIYDKVIVAKILGRELGLNQASELGEYIPFIRQARDDWYVTSHSANTDVLSYGKMFSPQARVYVQDAALWNQFRLKPDFKALVDVGDQDAIYLKNVLDTSDYMDGISFARALKVNPGAPWNEFEPESFFGYQRALDVLSDKAQQFRTLGLLRLEETLIKVHSTFRGRDFKNLKDAYRTEGIRGGGDEAGKTFLASTKQLETMKANPYLEVVSTPQGTDHLVHYFYPDALHFKKLKGKIPEELYKRLSAAQNLMSDHGLRNSLNVELITELMKDFLRRMKDGKTTWNDLISIHPFEDMNGRTVRMIQEIYDNGANQFILGDIDLLEPYEVQKAYWSRSAKAHHNFQIEMIEEFLTAKSERRMPDYLKTPALQNYVNRSFPTPMNINLNDPRTLDLIRSRQWLKLVEEGKAGGLEKLKLDLQNPYNYTAALAELLDVTGNDDVARYTAEELKQYKVLLEEAAKNTSVNLYAKMQLLPNYIVMAKAAYPTSAAGSGVNQKISSTLLEAQKAYYKTAKGSRPELMQEIHSLAIVENDKARLLSHMTSLISKDLSSEHVLAITDVVQNDLLELKRFNAFENTAPEQQKRVLLTVKNYVEKLIDLGYKGEATTGLTHYGNLHSVANAKVKAELLSAADLRKWTKKGGAGACTLMDLLTKMTP